MALNEIFCAHSTDKGTYHEYGPDYEQFIIPTDVKTMLEIGVWMGASLLAWYDWLPAAEVWGVDVMMEPECISNFERIHFINGNIADPNTISKLPTEFDLIIDDGSHTQWDIVAAIDLLWPRLNKGGWYVVEDIFVNPGLEDDLIEQVQPTEHHFISHHSELLFMKK